MIPSGQHCVISLPQHAIFINKIPSSQSNNNLTHHHDKEIINTEHNLRTYQDDIDKYNKKYGTKYNPSSFNEQRDAYLSDLERMKLVQEALNALHKMDKKYTITNNQTVQIKSQRGRPVYLHKDQIQIIKNNINHLIELEQAIHDEYPLLVSDKDKMKIINNNLNLLDKLEASYLLDNKSQFQLQFQVNFQPSRRYPMKIQITKKNINKKECKAMFEKYAKKSKPTPWNQFKFMPQFEWKIQQEIEWKTPEINKLITIQHHHNHHHHHHHHQQIDHINFVVH